MKKIAIRGVAILIALLFLLPLTGLLIGGVNIHILLDVFFGTDFLKAVGTTILIAVATLIINILIGTPAASVIGKYEFKGKKLVEVLIFLPLIIPTFVVSMGAHFTFIKLSLADTILGVILIHSTVTIPYYVRAVVVGYKTLGLEYEEMGYIMGASKLNRFFHISLPHIFPSIIAGSSMVIIVSFAQYINTFIIGGGRVVTITTLMFPYITSGQLRLGGVYSISFILVNLLFVVLLEGCVRKYYNKNLGDKRW